jgi:hypothetical protein
MWTAYDMLQELRAAHPHQFSAEQLTLFSQLQNIRRLWLPEERRRIIAAWHVLKGLPQPDMAEVAPAPLDFSPRDGRLQKRRGTWGAKLEREAQHAG